jgi:GxxExxY protein
MGLKEINYKDAMEIDFIDDDIPYETEKRFIVKYKDKIFKNPYYADYLIYESIIIEVKSVSCLTDAHTAEALSYLAVSGLKLAILINFGELSLTWKRVVL